MPNGNKHYPPYWASKRSGPSSIRWIPFKNKSYLTTVYTCGLRLHEALYLQIDDIDSLRMRIHVHRGKGAKDRYVPLSESTLHILRNYWKLHRNPLWIFPQLNRSGKEGPTATRPMAKSSVQGALRRVLKQLKITKRISYSYLQAQLCHTSMARGQIGQWSIIKK